MKMSSGIKCAKNFIACRRNPDNDFSDTGYGYLHDRTISPALVTLFFSAEDGYFVKHIVKTRLVGKVDITGPQEMSFPMVMDTDSKNELVKLSAVLLFCHAGIFV
ncbi:MAG: hypothetical protein MZV63_36345 [Marinilabiliales bacterium]|nr:hypothetical protein [Marinilabiliales bacterium]